MILTSSFRTFLIITFYFQWEHSAGRNTLSVNQVSLSALTGGRLYSLRENPNTFFSEISKIKKVNSIF